MPPPDVIWDHVRVVAVALEDGLLQVQSLLRLLLQEVEDQVPLGPVPPSGLEPTQTEEGLWGQAGHTPLTPHLSRATRRVAVWFHLWGEWSLVPDG